MNTYLITTTWSAGPRVTFKREHTRYAKTKASALAQERAHNRRDMPIMKLDQLPGDKPWKWKITGARQVAYKPLTAAGKARRHGHHGDMRTAAEITRDLERHYARLDARGVRKVRKPLTAAQRARSRALTRQKARRRCSECGR